ncbi:NAD(P)H-binding protein [Nocardia zapadnayensis]|uniref:SDR family oxidoreductase n=1 Tax=Nocardia rhamnosiphila TaxID=426716 RepID=UPI00224570B4|nr:NAD(P)H-binding protein [Nocardia zapadnayensis]MCX0273101.1 NAD(P)H-binding protein [Nocardia zapadnayensis]
MIDSRPSTTILVTGATGNIGRELLRQLAERGDLHIRAVTRDPSGATLPGAVEAVRADLRRPDSLWSALAGVTALFLVSQVGDDAAILSAARGAGVEHVVLVSSITVQSHPHLGPARDNAAVERLLETSGMDWTILRPTQFASNALWWADPIRESRSVELPFADIGLPAVDPADIAAVARVALTEPGHRGRRYALTGPVRISPRRQIDTIAAALGERISITEIGRARARERMIPQLGPRTADALLDVTGGDINEELLTVRDTVTEVTGSPARTFDDWVARNVSAFR